jgi:hypothetical protein
MTYLNYNRRWALSLLALATVLFLLAGPPITSSSYIDSETATGNILRINTEMRVPVSRTLYPSGNGSLVQCSRYPGSGESNWQNINEITADEDSTYNYQTADWTVDLYTLTSISAFSSYSSGTLAWVQVLMRSRSEVTPTAANAKNHIRTGGVEFDGTAVSTGITYANYSSTWNINPHTSNAWTWADIGTLQAGINIQRAKTGFKYTRVTRVWTVIRFIAPWYSYNDSGYTTPASTFSGVYKTVYLKGTNFSAGNYIIAYYDAGSGGGQKIASENITVAGDGQLLGSYYFPTLPSAVAGTWHALVQPASGYTAFPESYNTVTASSDTYGLVANDSFTVDASVLI